MRGWKKLKPKRWKCIFLNIEMDKKKKLVHELNLVPQQCYECFVDNAYCTKPLVVLGVSLTWVGSLTSVWLKLY